MRAKPIVAIDGPAGAGKSTVAQMLAEALGFMRVDTGAMYRAVALATIDAGLSITDADAVSTLAKRLLDERALVFESQAAGLRVHLYGVDVSARIRTNTVSLAASTVSQHPGVRSALLGLQRQAGEKGGVVLEGRDIATVVFPDADYKFFLTAKPEVRAKRRHEEFVARASIVPPSLEDTLRDVKARDAQDEGRAIAPLKPAADSIIVDASDLTLEQTVAAMLAQIAR